MHFFVKRPPIMVFWLFDRNLDIQPSAIDFISPLSAHEVVGPIVRTFARHVRYVVRTTILYSLSVKDAAIVGSPAMILQPMTGLSYHLFVNHGA
jgi:hypothetical protein